nr:MAG: hypothetical protein DIU67_10905 [Actinomycetota bacterium]
MIADPDHPSWLGWLSVLGGTGSVAIGILMFLGLVGPGPAVPFAVVLSIFMVIVGGRMWSEAG